MIDLIPQAFILLLGVSAVFLVGSKGPSRRYGYLCGILAQPFWLWTTIAHEQWGIAAMCLFYGFSWARGLRNHWRAAALEARIIRVRQDIAEVERAEGFTLEEQGKRRDKALSATRLGPDAK